MDITFTISTNFTGTSFTNTSEISDDDSEEYGTTDVDSDPDRDNTNDPYGGNDETDGDGTVDEDDSDPEEVMIGQIYDLALTKVINTTATSFPVYPGDDITYTINVINQGTLPAANIEVTDYTPTGLTLNDSDWTLNGTNAVTTIAGPIAPGTTTSVDITFTIDSNFTGDSFTNRSEISDDDSEQYGTTDPDSDPDGDGSNDTYGDDNQEDGNGGNKDTDGDGIPDIYDTDDDGDGILDVDDDDDDGDGIPDSEDNDNDEDDHDPATAIIGQIYDLALTKTVNTDETILPVYPGSDVTYTITVINQGTLPAANIEVTDYTPT